MRVLILAAFAVALSAALASPPVAAACIMSYCKDGATSTPAPSTSWAITNTSRQRLGDVYKPGHGRRLQLREIDRRILGYIERDGDITNKRWRKVGEIEELIQ